MHNLKYAKRVAWDTAICGVNSKLTARRVRTRSKVLIKKMSRLLVSGKVFDMISNNELVSNLNSANLLSGGLF